MRKVLLLITMLVMLSSTCFAERTFDDGTVLNDKEELVYDMVEMQSKYFVDPSSIRFKGVEDMSEEAVEQYKNGKYSIQVTLSARNEMGGRSITTYVWYIDGREALHWDGFVQFPDKTVDLTKLNHLWKTYHSDDE